MEYFITCQNHQCRKVHRVRDRQQQQRQRFCGLRCSGACCNGLSRAGQRKGGLVSAQRRRAAAMAKLKDLTPLEIFKRAYTYGWRAGASSARRKMGQAA